jgi:hypothetical protein
LEDKNYAIDVFEQHVEEVKRVVPPERLLVFEARQGWEPLCAFLGVAVPVDQPYPHRNNGVFVRWVLKYRTLLKWGFLIFLSLLLFLLVCALTP